MILEIHWKRALLCNIKKNPKQASHMQTEYSYNAKNTKVFAFLQHLQAYLGILQIFLSGFPAEFLKFPRVCPCADGLIKWRERWMDGWIYWTDNLSDE